MNNYDNWLGKISTGGNVYYGYDTSTSTGLTYKPKKTTITSVECPLEGELVYRGEKYRIDRVEQNTESIHASGEITIHGHRVGGYLDGFSGTFTIDDPGFIKDFKRAFNPYAIKKVVVNPKKNATTVIFEDGTVEVVKKSPDDPEADIFSVVAYAVAKHVYGSNSAFKREVLKNLDFIDREFEEIINRTPVEDLVKAMNKVAEHIKKKNRKEDDNEA